MSGDRTLLLAAVFLACHVLQRAAELAWSARNIRRLRARGAREYGRGLFPWIVLVHTLFPLGIAYEVFGLGTRPGPLWPLWAALFLGAQGLRYAAMRALGDFWNVRVWVVPGAALVRRGPYRWFRHPNYLAVVIELATAPLIFGAWRTSLGITVLNLIVLALRIRSEEAALAGGLAASTESGPA
jgi:methyltransferase